ncbi:MAG: cytochrome c oxidase subunit II [Phormidesmis priestleyi Ana]|uniref:Cytochrome c oxidase subunit 2 n=1 Tax=Phormidesmis priestleyi Ana TaxID=1666911 RepID=A0A0P8C752_9CYAN|nr:MAG: cytochrome c oxidase subunit II [Phormidesmis priestleyi Ana]
MNIPSSIVTLLVGIFVTLASLWYGQNHGLMPVAASAEAELVDGLFNTMMTIGFGLFLLVEGALVVAAVRFRRKEGDMGDGEHLEGNIPLEIVWTAIPAVVVLGISIYSFDIYTRMGGLDLMNHNMAPAEASSSVQVAYAPGEGDMPLMTNAANATAEVPAILVADATAGMGAIPGTAVGSLLSIDVKGLQYAFIFSYPNGIIDGELHIPVSQPVELNLGAQDVLHAFWLPEFRIKQDMIPGQDTRLVFTAIREGTYPVVCAELCGPYHGGMRTQIIVESPEEYQTWVDSRLTAMAAGDRTIANLPKAPADRSELEYLNNFVEPMQLAIAPESLAELQTHHTDYSPADYPHAEHHSLEMGS